MYNILDEIHKFSPWLLLWLEKKVYSLFFKKTVICLAHMGESISTASWPRASCSSFIAQLPTLIQTAHLCGICDDLNTKFQADTYSSNYLRAPYHNFFPRVAKTFSLSYFSLHIHRGGQLSSQSSHLISCFWDTFFHA